MAPAEAGDTGEAERLYREGQNFYETANYTAAIERWTAAFGLLDWEAETAAAKISLLYNLAAAHEKQFGISADPQNLRKARVLLQSFAERIPAIYGEGEEADAELARVNERIAEIDAQLQTEGGDADPPGDASPTPVPAPSPAAEASPTSDEGPRGAPGRGLFYAGIGVTTLGAVAGGAAIAFAVRSSRQNDFDDIDPLDFDARSDQISRGQTANRLAIGLGAAGVVMVGTGVALIVVGKRKQRAEASGARIDAFAPTFAQDRAGFALRGRF